MRNTFKIVATICIITILFFFLKGKISGQEFNGEKWRNANLNTEENWDLRWRMMNSLRNNYKLEGKKESEIIKLLGVPDSKVNNEMTYNLGYTGFGINTGTLIIYLNENRIVSKFKVHQG